MVRLFRKLLVLPDKQVGNLLCCMISSSHSKTTQLKAPSTLSALSDRRWGVLPLNFELISGGLFNQSCAAGTVLINVSITAKPSLN